jgi:hypothetical protein
MEIEEVLAHLQSDDGYRNRQSKPEAAGRVGERWGLFSAVGISGSRAMPQIGQLPGAACRI